MTSHPYSDRDSFERLMLLIATIAKNPGIGSPQQVAESGLDAIALVQQEMQAIATEQGIDLPDWSEHTIRKDLKTLRKYGIQPSGTIMRRGYYLGRTNLPKPPTVHRAESHKSKLSIAQIHALREQGLSLAEVGEKAGLSPERIRQILKNG